MYQVLPLSIEDQKKLYAECSHEQLINMLIQCNKTITTLCNQINSNESSPKCIHLDNCKMMACNPSICKYYIEKNSIE